LNEFLLETPLDNFLDRSPRHKLLVPVK
jgi:hypothetical protein